MNCFLKSWSDKTWSLFIGGLEYFIVFISTTGAVDGLQKDANYKQRLSLFDSDNINTRFRVDHGTLVTLTSSMLGDGSNCLCIV